MAYKTRSNTLKLQRLIEVLRERGSDLANSLEATASVFLDDVKPKKKNQSQVVYDSDDGSSYCEDDESWGSGWEEDFGDEEPPPLPKDPTPPPPITKVPAPTPSKTKVPTPPQSLPKDPTPFSNLKSESPPVIVKEVITPPIIVAKEVTPPRQVKTIPKQEPVAVIKPQVPVTGDPPPPKDDLKSKEVDQSKQIRPTAHLSGFESSKAVPTPLMKFSTHHVSIPTSFGATKSCKSSSDKNKHQLKVDVKKAETEIAQEMKNVPIKKEEKVKEIEPAVAAKATKSATAPVLNKAEAIPIFFEESKKEIGTKQKSPKVTTKSASQKRDEIKSSPTTAKPNELDTNSKLITEEIPVNNDSASKNMEAESPPDEQYYPVKNKLESKKESESVPHKNSFSQPNTLLNRADSSKVEPKDEPAKHLEESKTLVPPKLVEAKDHSNSHLLSPKINLPEPTHKGGLLSRSAPSSPKPARSIPSLSPETMQPHPPSPKQTETRSRLFKDSTTAMHRTESFPRGNEIRSTKSTDKIVSAPPLESKSSIFSFKEVRAPEPTRSTTEVKQIPVPVQTTPTTTATSTSFKTALLEIQEEQRLLPKVEVSTAEEIPISLPKEVETLLPDEPAVEYRSILLPEAEKEGLNRCQKNASPPKHVHFEQPQTPSPVAESSAPVFKSPRQVAAPSRLRERRTKPVTMLQQQSYNVPEGAEIPNVGGQRCKKPTLASQWRKQKEKQKRQELLLLERLETFALWPGGDDEENSEQLAAQIAEAGFYFTGLNDNVQCSICNLVLSGWAPSDDPWLKHAQDSPGCPYLEETKGAQWITDTLQAVA